LGIAKGHRAKKTQKRQNTLLRKRGSPQDWSVGGGSKYPKGRIARADGNGRGGKKKRGKIKRNSVKRGRRTGVERESNREAKDSKERKDDPGFEVSLLTSSKKYPLARQRRDRNVTVKLSGRTKSWVVIKLRVQKRPGKGGRKVVGGGDDKQGMSVKIDSNTKKKKKKYKDK